MKTTPTANSMPAKGTGSRAGAICRTAAIILCVVLMCSICLSCWDSRELDTLMIATGVGVDTVEGNPDLIEFTMQIGVAEKMGEGSGSGGGGKEGEESFISAIEATGVMSGIRKLRSHNSRTPFLHHTQMLVFGREQAEKGIQPHLDVFLREYEMRMEILVVIADETAKKLLQEPITPDDISAAAVTKLMERIDKYYSEAMYMNVLKLTKNLLVPQMATVIPIIKICEEQNPAHKTAKYKSIGIFKSDKLISEIPYEETDGYAWLSGEIKMRFTELFLPQGYANLSLQKSKIKFKPRIDKDNNCSMDIELCGDMAISELRGFDDMDVQDIIPLLQAEMKKVIEEKINSTLKFAQDLRADIFGFAGRYHRAHPKKWRTIKDNWDNHFAAMTINIKNKLKVTETGKITNSLHMEEKDDR